MRKSTSSKPTSTMPASRASVGGSAPNTKKSVSTAIRGRRFPISVSASVDSILRELIERFGWEPEEQDGNIIALTRDKATDYPRARRADRAQRRAVREHPLHLCRIHSAYSRAVGSDRAARHHFPRTGHAAGKPLGRDRVGAEATLPHHGAVHAQGRRRSASA